MRHDSRPCVRWALGVTGIATLIGSGGGAIGFPPYEPPDPGAFTPGPTAEIDPARQTVQVGGTARFVVLATRVTHPSYRWCRIAPGSDTCTDIAGATGDSYAVASVNLADDGAIFRVTLTDPAGSAAAAAALFVASMPPVVFQDGDFAAGEWTLEVAADPAQGGPGATVATIAAGGHPGAYRQTTISVPAVPASLIVYQSALAARYEPALQGAVHRVDASEDCVQLGSAGTNAVIWNAPLLEQSGRRYVATDDWLRACSSDTWGVARPRAAMTASDFRPVDGAACAAGTACPDFGVGAAPIQWGFAHIVRASAAASVGTRTRGLDNWRITVWPK